MNPLFIFGTQSTPLRKLLLMKIASGGGKLVEYTVTGNPVTFETDVAKPLPSVLASWQPHQSGSGDPSPSNVRPVVGMDGVNVWQTGKNLFDASAVVRKDAWLLDDNGREQPTTQSGYTQNRTSVKEGATYTINGTIVKGSESCRLYFYTGDTFVSRTSPINVGAFPYTFTVPVGCDGVAIQYNMVTFDPSTIQIELGETASEYSPYHGTSYSVAFPVMGNNLLNVNRTAGTPNPTDLRVSPRIMDVDHYFVGLHSENYYVPNYASASVSDGVVSVTRTSAGNNSYGVGFPVAVEGGEQYTFNVTAENVIIGLSYYDEQWNYIGVGGDIYKSSLPKTFTVPSNASYAVIIFRAENNSTYTYSNIMLNKGTSALPYEPYTRTCYGGTLDLTTGVLTAEYMQKVSDGSETIAWNVATSSGLKRAVLSYANFGEYTPKASSTPTLKTSYFVSSPSASIGNAYIGSTGNFLCYPPSEVTTKEEWLAYLAEHPLQIVYELETPVVLATLTPTQITALIGNNTMWADSDSLSVTYLKKG